MSMLPQPPPDAPVPPASQAEVLSQRKWAGFREVGLVSILLVVLVGLVPQPTTRGKSRPHQREAVNNARQIGLALFGFEAEYGKLPDDSTMARVRAETSIDLDLGMTSSNEIFRQLIATGIAQSERMFYANIEGAQKPDNVMIKGEALKKGECGFTYFIGAKATDNPSRPLAATPMIPGTDRFDPKKFNGMAVILKRDNSVISLTIDNHGHARIDGRNLMDPHHPIWDGHPPVIAWPE
jgi:hypothetical protein